jgi:hypothetical protein
MTRKKVHKRVGSKGETTVVRQKKDSGNGKIGQKALKYPFDTLNKGESFTIENADQMTGAVTVRENVRVLAFEYGKRHGLKFKVSPIEEGKCTVTRLK